MTRQKKHLFAGFSYLDIQVAVVSSPFQAESLLSFSKARLEEFRLQVFLQVSKDRTEFRQTRKQLEQDARISVRPVVLLSSIPELRGSYSHGSTRDRKKNHRLINFRNFVDQWFFAFSIVRSTMFRRVKRVIVGDLIYGHGLAMATIFGRNAEIVLLDDGSATLEIMSLRSPNFSEALSSNTAETFLPERTRDRIRHIRSLTFFTIFNFQYSLPRDKVVKDNRFCGVEVSETESEVWIIGTNLVEVGAWLKESYLVAVSNIVLEAKKLGLNAKYFPHRLENTDKFDLIDLELEISKSPKSIEQFVSDGMKVGAQIVTFPSTAAFTLDYLVSGGSDLRLALPPRSIWVDEARRGTYERLVAFILEMTSFEVWAKRHDD